MSERQSCDNCKYYRSQECRRHAPIGTNKSYDSPNHPIIVEGFLHWCGDWEKKIKVIK